MILWLKSIFGSRTFGAKRSPKWRQVRKEQLLHCPRCECCGGKKKLVAHHIKSFHLYPELELTPSNLMTLCESKKYGINCHLLIGHYGNYKRVNYNAKEEAKIWKKRILNIS